MPQLDIKFDAVITDIPYGTTACSWDSVIPFDIMWEQLNRLIKPDGVIVLFGSEPFSSYLRISNIKDYKYDWVWNKVSGSNFLNLKNRPLKTHENVIIFSKSAKFTFNPIRTFRTKESLKRYPADGKEVCIKYKREQNSKVEHYSNFKATEFYILASDGKKHPIDIIKFSLVEKGRYDFKHPTKKPLGLLEYLVKTYTNENDIVLDFTSGSGTTGVACEKLNRKCIMIEKEKKYCKVAEKRLLRETRQLRLFT
jgi:site-specific DNA-methyltransferase (adenine-specific)